MRWAYGLDGDFASGLDQGMGSRYEVGDESRFGLLRRMYEQRRRLATGAAAVLAFAVGYHVVFGQNGLTAYEKKKQDTRMLQQELRDLNAENDALKGHVERLENDPGAIEHQARETLHYTRPGEVIVTLPETPASDAHR
jgi:cell division protein FtsB